MQNPESMPKPSPPREPARYSWSEVWTAALTRPRVDTFRELLNDPRAEPRRAYTWMFLTLLVSTFVTLNSIFGDPIFREQLAQAAPTADVNIGSVLFTTVLCAAPFAAGFGVLFFMLFCAAVQFTASQMTRLDDPPATFRQLTYALAASIAPLNLVGAVFFILPMIGFLSLFVSIYQIVLMVLGARAVYGFDVRSGSIAVMVPGAVLMFIQLMLFNSL